MLVKLLARAVQPEDWAQLLTRNQGSLLAYIRGLLFRRRLRRASAASQKYWSTQ